jgi:uncharacterized DUF497 family protein
METIATSCWEWFKSVLAVTYTLRGERIRIVSARPAEPFERRLYHEKDRKA